jgi:hypothetical protein
MSASVIALLYAFAEAPDLPPAISSEYAFGDTNEDAAAAQTDFTAGDLRDPSLLEIEPTQTDLAEAGLIQGVPAHENQTPSSDEPASLPYIQAPGGDPDLWLYRKRTVGLLRRYMRLSIEVGRLPSLLGREFFRTRVTSYRASTFEDAVIFVTDVERSLEKLSEFDKKLIAKIVLQEYSQEEAARLIGCGHRHTARCYVEALDRVSEVFLKRKLLLRLPCVKAKAEKSCQGGKPDQFHVSDSEQAENNS